MKNELDHIFIMSSDELAVLFAGKDIKHGVMLQEEEKQIDQTAVCMAMAHLYEKQFIYNKDGKFGVSDELDDILSEVKNAEKIYLLRNRTQSKYAKIIYCGDQMVCLTRSSVDAAALKIYKMRENLISTIKEDFQDICQPYQIVLDEESICDRLLRKKYILSLEELEQSPNITGIVEMLNCKNQNIENRIFILQDKLEPIMFHFDGQEISKVPFNPLEMDQVMVNMLQGEKL